MLRFKRQNQRKQKPPGRYNPLKEIMKTRGYSSKDKGAREEISKNQKAKEQKRNTIENRELVRQELQTIIPFLQNETISNLRTRFEKDGRDILSLHPEKRTTIIQSIIEKTINQAENKVREQLEKSAGKELLKNTTVVTNALIVQMERNLETELKMLSIQILEKERQKIIRERVNARLEEANINAKAGTNLKTKSKPNFRIAAPSQISRRKPIIHRKQPFKKAN